MLLTQRKNGLPLGLLFQLFFFLPSSASSSLSFFLCWMHPFNIEIWVRHHQFVTSAFMTLCIFALLWKIITNPGLGRLDIDIYIPAHPHDVLLIFVSFYVHTINPFEIHLKGQCDRWTWLWFLNEQSFASLPFFFFWIVPLSSGVSNTCYYHMPISYIHKFCPYVLFPFLSISLSLTFFMPPHLYSSCYISTVNL